MAIKQGERSGTDRRSVLRAGAAIAVAAPFLSLGQHRVFAASPETYSTRTLDLVSRCMVIDMLAPVVIEADSAFFSKPLNDRLRQQFKTCGITGFHNAAGIGGPNARQDAADWMASWNGFAARNSDIFSMVGGLQDLERAKAEGKVAIIQGVQNSEHFRTVEDVKLFYAMGQRCSQLTYNAQNLLGSGATERVDGGLTDYGAAVVKAMNDIGMLVDVSHSGDKTTLDAIAASAKPIAITHSNCRALNNHPRLKTDEAIRALAAKGGVMGITGVRMFVRDKEPTTIEHLVDHIDHVRRLVGIAHVGIGSDADLNGYDDMSAAGNKLLRSYYKAGYAFREKLDIEGFDHPRKTYDLTEALIRRGYSDGDIEAVLGGNFRRLLGQVWL